MKKNKKLWSFALAGALAVSNLSAVAMPFTSIVAQAALPATATLSVTKAGAAVTTAKVGDVLTVSTSLKPTDTKSVTWSYNDGTSDTVTGDVHTETSWADVDSIEFTVPRGLSGKNLTFKAAESDGSTETSAAIAVSALAAGDTANILVSTDIDKSAAATLKRGESATINLLDANTAGGTLKPVLTQLRTMYSVGGSDKDYFDWEIASGSDAFEISPTGTIGETALLSVKNGAMAGNTCDIKVTYYAKGVKTTQTATATIPVVVTGGEVATIAYLDNTTNAGLSDNIKLSKGQKITVVAKATPVGYDKFKTGKEGTMNWIVVEGKDAVTLGGPTGASNTIEAKEVSKETKVTIKTYLTGAQVDVNGSGVACSGSNTFSFTVSKAPTYSVSLSSKSLTFNEGDTRKALVAEATVENDDKSVDMNNLYYAWVIADETTFAAATNFNNLDNESEWVKTNSPVEWYNDVTTNKVEVALKNNYSAGKAYIGVAIFKDAAAYKKANKDLTKALALSWCPDMTKAGTATALDKKLFTKVVAEKNVLSVSAEKKEYVLTSASQNEVDKITITNGDGKVLTDTTTPNIVNIWALTKANYEALVKAGDLSAYKAGKYNGYDLISGGGGTSPVDPGLRVSALKSGATISLTAKGTPKVGSYVMIVEDSQGGIGTYNFMTRTDKGIAATGVVLDLTDVILANINDVATINATVTPNNQLKGDKVDSSVTFDSAASAEIPYVDITSSDENVVIVDAANTVAATAGTNTTTAIKIKAVKPGKATITVTTVDGGFTATANVEVNGVESITVTGTDEISVGKTTALTATVNAFGSAARTVTWKSSDASVATVDANGVVTGVKAGTATITATALADTEKTASITITVKDKTEADKKAEEEAAKKAKEEADKKAAEEAAKKAAEEAAKAGLQKNATAAVSGTTYTGLGNKTVSVKSVKNKKSVTIKKTVKINGQTHKVTKVAKGAFKGSKVQSVTIDAKYIKKAANFNVNAFKGAKNLKSVKIKNAKKGGAVWKQIVKAAQKANKDVKIK